MRGKLPPTSQPPALDEKEQQIAIASSPAYFNLIRYALDDGEDEEAIRDFLWRIRAPRKLPYLRRISTRIGLMLQAAKTSWDVDLRDFGLEGWPAIVEYIIDKNNRNRFANELGGDFDPPIRRENEHVLDHLTDWEPYPAYLHDRKSLDDRYLLLQAHLLFAYAWDVNRNTDIEDYQNCTDPHSTVENNPYKAGKAVRFLSADKECQSDLICQLPVFEPPFTFARILRTVRIPERESLAEAHKDIRSYLELVYGLRHRSGGGSGGNGGGAIVEGHVSIDAEEWRTADLSSDPDDQFAPSEQYTSVAQSSVRPIERKQLAQLDICPAEFDGHSEIVKTSFREKTAEEYIDDPAGEASKDPSGYSTIIGASLNHIEMANQLLWFAYDVPTTEEIARVLYTFFTSLRERPHPWEPSGDELLMLETYLVALTMIATGASLEKASHLHVCPDGHTPGEHELQLVLNDDGRRTSWRLRACLPEYQTEQSCDPRMQAYIDLPDVVHAELLARILLRARSKHRTDPCVPIIRNGIDNISSSLRNHLRAADESQRTTIAKLPKFIFAHLVSQSGGDVADACLASLYWHHLARVPTFYSNPKVKRLQRLYAVSVQHLGREIRSAIRVIGCLEDIKHKANRRSLFEVERGKKLPDAGTTHGPIVRSKNLEVAKRSEELIGNRRCPTRDDVSSAMKKIKKMIRALSPSKLRANLIKRHNLYTLYTLEFYAASVGVRAVKSPYKWLDEIDDKTGFAVLTEKTVRPAWLPPTVVRQMKEYDKYLHEQSLVQPLPTFKGKRPAPCFLVNKYGTALEVTPTVKADFLKEYCDFDFAANIFRRFIRNELREGECPASVAKAWLSHAARGEEIHHMYSQFSLGAYRQALRHYLLPILDAAGFEVLDSHGKIC